MRFRLPRQNYLNSSINPSSCSQFTACQCSPVNVPVFDSRTGIGKSSDANHVTGIFNPTDQKCGDIRRPCRAEFPVAGKLFGFNGNIVSMSFHHNQILFMFVHFLNGSKQWLQCIKGLFLDRIASGTKKKVRR